MIAPSIASDDSEVANTLRAKIAELETTRERMKTLNAGIRRVNRDKAKLTDAMFDAIGANERERRELLNHERFTTVGARGYPTYSLTNLGANIRRYKERLEQLECG